MSLERIGTVKSLHRYPVRSMGGESASSIRVEKLGVLGDRAYGVVDAKFTMMAAAKKTSTWGALVRWQARYLDEPELGKPPPPIRLTDADGAQIEGDLDAYARALSEAFDEQVELWRGDGDGALALPARKKRNEAGLPEIPYGAAPVHLITTASQAEGQRIHPGGDFSTARFRPNVVVDLADAVGFVEAGWIGKTLRIGDSVRLSAFMECERCVETTLPQAELPSDPKILKTVVDHNNTNFGIYLGVTEPGALRVGDAVILE